MWAAVLVTFGVSNRSSLVVIAMIMMYGEDIEKDEKPDSFEKEP